MVEGENGGEDRRGAGRAPTGVVVGACGGDRVQHEPAAVAPLAASRELPVAADLHGSPRRFSRELPAAVQLSESQGVVRPAASGQRARRVEQRRGRVARARGVELVAAGRAR